MKVIIFIILIIAFATCIKPYSEQECLDAFKEFVVKYSRAYASHDETQKRYKIFKANLQKIRIMNFVNKDNTFGLTRFMDLSENEFQTRFLSHIPYHKNLKASTVEIINDLPENFTWVEKNAVTKVKNQGSCGSCWAFSAIGNLESRWHLAGNDLIELSEQELVDCDHECDPEHPTDCDEGCNGGLMHLAFNFIKKNGGICSEKDYPYKGYGGTCKKDQCKNAAHLSGYDTLNDNEEEMASYLYKNGPLAVALNANPLQYYSKGILDPSSCNPAALNHGVLIVGFGVENGKKYWTVKNSWGSGWGEKGYFRIVRGKGKCGINTYVVSATI